MSHMSPQGIPRYIAGNYRVYPAQMGTQSLGRFQARCTTAALTPIANATVSVTAPNQNAPIDQLTTDESGLTEVIELPAPPIEYSMEPSTSQPYYNYDLNISAPGYVNSVINSIEIFPAVTSLQEQALVPVQEPGVTGGNLYVVPPHTLFGDYPPKIPEAEVKPTGESGEIVLSSVVVPEFVVVHDGPPTDSSAQNHYQRFRDYIKNVASSEIYSTWPENTIYANIFAILSFTLNRVYTEWYRNQGYSFTITSSTAYDHKWVNGRNIYDNISRIVDSIFINYLSRPNIRQPILTQYCDGNRVSCPNWLSQWGSKTLGDQGLSAIQILRNYYGNSIFINTATEVSGVPSSWPGENLTIGSSGAPVRTIQEQLNRIAQNYPAIPTVAVDGQFGPQTAEAVSTFQRIFGLPANGIVDFPTWYRISGIYVAVTRMAEL